MSGTTIQKSSPNLGKVILKSLDELRDRGQFGQEIYGRINALIGKIAGQYEVGLLDDDDIDLISSYYGREFLENTLQGSALLKKFGYAGDFLMIDQIYTGRESQNPFYESWNKYFMSHLLPRPLSN